MSETEERGSGDGGETEVQLGTGAVSEGGKVPGREQVVRFFPAKLKSYYLQVLAKYKDEQSAVRGQAVGWLTIRDEIMKKEDAEQARREGVDPNAAKNKSRSDALTLDDLKGWYKAGKTHLPSDFKFQFIDRFVRGLRLNGQLDAIELAVAEAQREYFRRALFEYYRPDRCFGIVAGSWKGDLVEGVKSNLSKGVFVGVCDLSFKEAEKHRVVGILLRDRVRFLLLVLCGEYSECMAAADLFVCPMGDAVWKKCWNEPGANHAELEKIFSRLSAEEVWASHIYSGFIVPAEVLRPTSISERHIAAMFVSRKTYGDFDDGFAGKFLRIYSPLIGVGVGNVASSEETEEGKPTFDVIWSAGWSADGAYDIFGKLGLMEPLQRHKESKFSRSIREKFAVGYRPC